MKVGIIGCGRVATRIHLPLLKGIKGIEVVAAADINEDRLHKTVEKHHIDEGYADYRQMLEKVDIDATFVCTPPETHFQIVMDSIKYGKHILCERPIATTIKEGLAIKRALEMKQEKTSRRLVLMPAHNYVFTPCFTQALRFVKDGEIGNLQRIRGDTVSNLTFYEKAIWMPKTDFRIYSKGGVIEDNLLHVVYLCNEAGGQLEKVLSVEPRRRGHAGVDDVSVEVKLMSEVIASLSARWTFLLDGFIPTLKFDMIGDSGQIKMDLLKTPYNLAIVKDGEAKTINMGRGLRQYLDVARWTPSKHPSYMNEHLHFFRCIEGTEPARVTVDDGIELVRTLNEIMALFEKSPYPPAGRERTVILRAGEDIESTVRKSIDLLGGLSVKRGDLVVIKPNVCYPKNVENMVITDPRALEAVINIVKTKTRDIIVVESDSMSGTADYRLTKSGMMDLIKKWDVEFLNLSRDEVEEHKVAGLTLQISKTVMKADFFINISKVKTHEEMLISIAMKNMFGVLANKKKSELHSHLAEVLAFINHTIRQDLIIVDGIVGMEGLGPIQGSPVNLGLIISGLNPVTVDAVSCHIMGFNPYAVETLWRAYKAGVGEIDIKRIQVLGENIDDVKKRFSQPVRSPKNVYTALKTGLKSYLRK